MQRGDQRAGAVDHRGVDDLSLAGALRFDQCAEHADREVHAAAAEVADEVERRHGRLAHAPDRRQRAGERDVVDVVAGHLRVGPLLTPAGHAAEDEPLVARQADIGAEPEAFHDAGPEALEERVGALDQLKRDLDAVGMLEVECDRASAAGEQIAGRLRRHLVGRVGGAIDADDVGAHVGEDHAAERSRPDTLKFNDPNALEWPHDERSLCAARTRAANRRRSLRWQDTAMTACELRIGPAGPADAAEVIELIHRVFDEYGFIWDPDDEFWDLLADEFPYLAPRGAMWVSRDPAGRVVGSIAAELLDAQTAELHRLYLDAGLRGAGHGRRLLLHAVDWARALGCERVELWSDTRFDQAHRLYDRLGFRRAGERRLADVNETTEYRYERAIGEPERSSD